MNSSSTRRRWLSPWRLVAGITTALVFLAGCSPADSGLSATASAPTGSAEGGGAVAQVLSATEAFLARLDPAQKVAVVGERTQANLSQWSNLPDNRFQRAGLQMGTLSQAQRDAVMKIFQVALSDEGYQQLTQIAAGDGVLAAQAGPGEGPYGPDLYWIRILGTPATAGTWTVQFGGHHLAVNVTMSGTAMTLAPSFWGAHPAVYDQDGRYVEPMRGETSKAFALVESLDPAQLDAAVLDAPVTEPVLGAGQDGKTLVPEGVQASTFTDAQKTLLLDLVSEWINTLNPEQAAAKLEAVKTHLDETTFAWSGSTFIGNPIYYRLQGPTFTIEFGHQQGQQYFNTGGITHVHSIYREPGNDYGAGLGS